VCQLHGGDIGVSSKEGEGSTFGFFFKVRRSDGTSENGRPPFSSRTNSENSQSANRDATPARPGYSRANSHLTQIKERPNERPGVKTLTSHGGVDLDKVDDCLLNPPTEYIPESHPESSEDSRYRETASITQGIQPEESPVKQSIEDKLPDLQSGETQRQEKVASDTSRSQSNQRIDEKQTLLLVEDNLINQKVLRRQLQTRGFEVFVANNGQEAIDAVAKRGKISADDPHDRDHFDIILMDQEMPIKDGNQATQEIRALQDQGKAGYSHIIGVSANVREAQTQSMRNAGMDDIISKPFKVEDLVNRIKSIMMTDGSSGQKQGHRLPATNTGENEEVRMLEDIPIRSRSQVSGKDGGEMEAGGKARIELDGQQQDGNENTPKDEPTSKVGKQEGQTERKREKEMSRLEEDAKKRAGRQEKQPEHEKEKDKTSREEGAAKKAERQGKQQPEQEEDRDRREGKEGKKSGREGELRGGERSHSRQTR
jgi:CheY-like chemotaxis protein